MPLRARRGVGKTSVSAGVAQALAESGHRTLLIDFDP
ncbi:AAA family ATPase [Streptomyces sp. Qhu-G9]|nr:AAA family ATPase [Streptomyces aurantiacus]WAU82580.1 AAA family ATPase [Streptomyces aurantiacus]